MEDVTRTSAFAEIVPRTYGRTDCVSAIFGTGGVPFDSNMRGQYTRVRTHQRRGGAASFLGNLGKTVWNVPVSYPLVTPSISTLTLRVIADHLTSFMTSGQRAQCTRVSKLLKVFARVQGALGSQSLIMICGVDRFGCLCRPLEANRHEGGFECPSTLLFPGSKTEVALPCDEVCSIDIVAYRHL